MTAALALQALCLRWTRERAGLLSPALDALPRPVAVHRVKARDVVLPAAFQARRRAHSLLTRAGWSR
jgi:hypothetical protein